MIISRLTASTGRARSAALLGAVVCAGAVTGTSAASAASAAPLSHGAHGASQAAAAPIAQPGPRPPSRHHCPDVRRLPRIVTQWEAAWNSGDPGQLAHLFTSDARYTDHAFGATFTGTDGVRSWAEITARSIDDARIDVQSATRRGRTVEIRWTFSGQLVGAPRAFSVPAVTMLTLKGNSIRTNDDRYDLAEVLRQSGLPADTTFG